jgi:uncharacterized protein
VAYYLTGAEEWEYADALSRTSTIDRVLYLHGSRGATAGSLTDEVPRTEDPDRYTYDPLDTRPDQVENDTVNLGWWPGHYFSIVPPATPVPNIFGNGVIYETTPLAEDIEISGFPELTVWMSLDTPDTDFQVMLYEVLADGRNITLSVDRMRARYRRSPVHETLAKPGEIDRYEFGSFTFMARRVAKGSRLRIVLISPNSIYSEKNYNAGGLVTHESGKDARTVHVTVYHDSTHRSELRLPIIK